ncbi:YehS family protein [Enterococcus hermanniensis]|uniref:Cytoplasmic protein n=1 Tax=Enterococcus hermanniensis TaxID=249189 RepID=A0A1L8TMS2_9ENTE|nr:DUF1456 family protein [Enterococcus hermanniensis]OJG45606.1 hypothetical protein RV04_GL001895 [Enterococcus hermanniensis]
MNNNDRLLRLRYAVDIKDQDLIRAFELGGMTVTHEEVSAMLTKEKETRPDEDNIYLKPINNHVLDSFLNGFITLKRGPQKNKSEVGVAPRSKEIKYINNILLKKLKIALFLTSDDMLTIFAEAGVYPSKGELGAILRKEGHRNFKPCGDKYMRNFLKGLGICYRAEENR